MKKRIIAFVSVLVVIVAAIAGYTVYRNRSNSAASPAVVRKASKAVTRGQNGKVLVVYFSRTQGVYWGGLKVGNTARVAQLLKQKLAATLMKSYQLSLTLTATMLRPGLLNVNKTATRGQPSRTLCRM